MEQARFDDAMAALNRLLDAGLSDLSSLFVSPLRGDGIPQDWVDDMINMTLEQRQAMASVVTESSPAWARALSGHLLG